MKRNRECIERIECDEMIGNDAICTLEKNTKKVKDTVYAPTFDTNPMDGYYMPPPQETLELYITETNKQFFSAKDVLEILRLRDMQYLETTNIRLYEQKQHFFEHMEQLIKTYTTQQSYFI